MGAKKGAAHRKTRKAEMSERNLCLTLTVQRSVSYFHPAGCSEEERDAAANVAVEKEVKLLEEAGWSGFASKFPPAS